VFTITSATVSVPKVVPVIAFLDVTAAGNPLSVLPLFNATPFPPAFTMVVALPPVFGRRRWLRGAIT